MSDEKKTTEAPTEAPNLPKIESAIPADELARLTDDIVGGLKSVYDPEIPVDIYELGLIYKVDIADDRAVTVDMTLTSPNCPAAVELPGMVENAVSSVRASDQSRSTSCLIRPGIRVACRPKKHGSRSISGENQIVRAAVSQGKSFSASAWESGGRRIVRAAAGRLG